MARVRPWEWRHGERFERSHAHGSSCCRTVDLLRFVPPPFPRDQGTTGAQERGGILDEHRQRREGAGSDEIVDLQPGGPSLGAGVDHVDIRELQALDGGAQEGALASRTLYQRDVRVRKRDGKGKAGEPAARAEVRDRARRPHCRQFESDEGVGHVDVDPLGRIAHRRDRAGLLFYEVEQQREPMRRRGWQSVAIRELRESGGDV